MFHRDFQVVRHARGQSHRLRKRPEHPAVLRFEPVKGLSGVPVQRRDAHQPDQLQALRLLDPRTDFVDRAWRSDVDAAPGYVPIEADLDIRPQPVFAAAIGQRRGYRPVQRGDQPRAVDGVRGVGPAGQGPDFVPLELAHHVPLHAPGVRPVRLANSRASRQPSSKLPVRAIRQPTDNPIGTESQRRLLERIW